jgi:glycerate-2-kinase
VPWVSRATSASAWRRVVPGDHSFFQVLGDAVVTGPSLTNVNDFRAIMIEVA